MNIDGSQRSRREVLMAGLGVVLAAAMPIAGRANSTTEANPSGPKGETPKGEQAMNTITTKDGTKIAFEDYGSGQPVVFSHGWPLSSDDWDDQIFFFASRGFRSLLTIVGDMVGRVKLGMVTIWTLTRTI
ncbi:MAG: alpha/beta hydrolase [Pyrinomonadaceae bacterium]